MARGTEPGAGVDNLPAARTFEGAHDGEGAVLGWTTRLLVAPLLDYQGFAYW